MKSLRSVLILCLVAVFGSFIALEALGVKSSGEGNLASSSSAENTETLGTLPSAEEEEKSNALNIAGEPSAEEVVTVLVGLKGAPLGEVAVERGLSLGELYGGFDGAKLWNDRNAEIDGAISSLGGVLLSTGYRYTALFNGFSAQVHYGDISRIETNEAVGKVVLSNSYEAPSEITENDVNVQDTGIFDSTDVEYDGTGTVVAVLDTGTDYTHEVFDMTLDANTMAITKDDVAAKVPYLTATSWMAGQSTVIDEDELYISTKLPYGFDYADIDTNVYPKEAHGTHVAGIIAGESQRIRGVAPRAQIATFKVFKDSGTSTSEGILAALEDAVILEVDAVNMSLGASCGFTRDDDEETNRVYDLVESMGISLVVAAGNQYSSAYGGANGNTNLASNPDSGTIGSPASYYASFAVASISGVKTPYMIANGEKEIYYNESRTTGKTKPNNFVNELLGDRESGEFEYVVIPGVGYESNYTGFNVEGKIAVVKRGSNSFEDKVKTAKAMGAAGVIIYNNLSGMLNMSIGTKNVLPSCLVSMDFGNYLAGIPNGKIVISKEYLAGPFMSDFSSWGPLPNLNLCPDITGHGGDITSSYPGRDEYDTISGTSMACPNIAGALVLVRQYVKNRWSDLSTVEVRDRSYNLMMSTATIARNEEGNPYSPRKQGAGIGDIKRSTATRAYLSVEGSNKAKLSLGDDPAKEGVYRMTFRITNVSGEAVSYKINPIVMTESMSSDGKTVAEKAYMLNPGASYEIKKISGGEAVLDHGNTVCVGGYTEAEITVTVNLSSEDRAYLDANFINGMYVEGYVELESCDEDNINLNIPFLAFYGDWAQAPMLDVSAYEVGESAVDSSVLAEDKLVADVYGTLPMAGFATTDDNGDAQVGSWGLGAFGYNVAQGYELPVTRERYASLTHNDDGNYLLYTIGAGLLRNAKRVDMEIRDAVTGELVWSLTDFNARKSSSNGGDQTGGYVMVEFDVRDYDLANNGKYTFNMVCYLDWDKGEGDKVLYGTRNTFSFDFYIDDEKPVLESTYVRDENHRKTVEFNVYDNHYLQGFILYTYESLDANGDPVGLTNISNGVIPVYNGEFNGTTRVSVDVTSYWSAIEKNNGNLYVQFMDYAKNSAQFSVQVKECEDVRLDYTRDVRDDHTYTVRPNGQIDLEDYVRIYANVEGEEHEGYWTKDLQWKSLNEEIASVDDGLVTGLTAGEATIEVRPDPAGSAAPLTFTIRVAGETAAITVREVELTEYSMSLERGEERTIEAKVLPSNYVGQIVLDWSSSSANVRVTKDPDNQYRATVKALKSGSASISVRVQGTYINASCSVRVREEYYVDGVYLRSYTGRGDENGVVEIPDDLGVAYIYPMAFFQNPYITKIIIPEGVQYIMRAAIYGCDRLEEIVLPESCTELQTFAVAWNPRLKKINTEHLQTIGSRAFIYDTALEEIDLSRVTHISNMAFTYCTALKKVDLGKVGTVGRQAFQGCTALTELVLPAHTTTEYAAFYGCTGLKRVTAYNSQIGPLTFQECSSLIDVTFVGDVELIGVQAFYGCVSLSNVNFLGTVYEIGALAFAANYSLTSFTLPAGLTKLGQQALVSTRISRIVVDKDARIIESELAAFGGLTYLTEFKVEEGNKYLRDEGGVLYDKTMTRLVAYPFARSNAAGFTVPSTVRIIGANAFTGVTAVSSVDLNNVERIEDNAFRGCTAAITGATKVSYIGNYAFAGNISTRSFGISAEATETERGDSSATDDDNTGSASGSAGASGSSGSSGTTVTDIATNLTALPITAVTAYIGDYAFANCINLTQTAVTLPESVKHVGEFAFYNCPIERVSLGNGLKTVGLGAFSHCTELTEVDFGSLEEISPEMFANCTALEQIDIPATVKSVGGYAFYGASALGTVSLPDGLTAIPDYAFYGTAIENISVPASVVTVGDSAFRNTSLSSFDFGHITTIGARAFEGTGLTAVSSATVQTVGNGAFRDSALTSVSFENAYGIGASAFAGCESLGTAALPAAKAIGASAFEGCTALNAVTASAAETLGEKAFYDDGALTALTLPALQKVEANAFGGTQIATLSLPALQEAAQQAFAGADALQSINVGAENARFLTEDGVLYAKNSGNFFTLVAYPLGKTGAEYTVKERTVKVGAYAFAENPSLTKIILPVHLKVIGVGAFYGMDLLAEVELKAAAAPTLESVGKMEGDELVNTYSNLKAFLGEEMELTWTVPLNATGYDSYIWKQYGAHGLTVQRTEENALNNSALDFIDRVNALASLPAAERAAEIAVLARIYNMLDATQKGFDEVREAYAKLQATPLTGYAEELPADGTTAAENGGWALPLLLAAAVFGGALAVVTLAGKRNGRREK